MFIHTKDNLRTYLNGLSGSEGFGCPYTGRTHEEGLDVLVDIVSEDWEPGMSESKLSALLEAVDLWEAIDRECVL